MLDPAYQETIERRLAVPLHEGPDKVTTLADAVRHHVHAGDTVYAGSAHGRPNPIVRELVRQWWGKAPGFTLAAVGVGSPWTEGPRGLRLGPPGRAVPAPLPGALSRRAGARPPLRPAPLFPGRMISLSPLGRGQGEGAQG